MVVTGLVSYLSLVMFMLSMRVYMLFQSLDMAVDFLSVLLCGYNRLLVVFVVLLSRQTPPHFYDILITDASFGLSNFITILPQIFTSTYLRLYFDT